MINPRAWSLEGGKAARAVHTFRASYFDFDSELATLTELGIKYARVPVSWCWTDHDPSEMVVKDDYGSVVYMSDEEVKDKFACRDPFYEDVYLLASEFSFVSFVLVIVFGMGIICEMLSSIRCLRLTWTSS